MIRVFLAIIISMFVVGSSFAADTDVLYDGLYSRPTYFPDFVEPNKWPNNMTCFVLAYDEKGVQLDNYEVAVYDQDGELRAIGRSIPSQHNLCALTIMGTEGDVFSFQIIYGDFVNPEIRDTYTTCEFYTNKTISASNPLQLIVRSELVVYAEEDPDNAGVFYGTFYNSTSAFNIPSYATAYTGMLKDDDELSLQLIQGSTIPEGEPVIIKSDRGFIVIEPSEDQLSPSADNQLKGVDVASDQQAGLCYFKLDFGKDGVGFYKMNNNESLEAHKAFLAINESDVSTINMFKFERSGVDSLESINQTATDVENIYNVNGIKLANPQSGVNIIGKKIILLSE